jgi:hypothetical protein
MKSDRSPFRYLPWLARDVASTAGILFVVVAVIVCVVIWRVMLAGQQGMMPSTAQIQGTAFNQVMLVMSLIAAGGMVSGDLHGGYYRAYFSKPMATWWYYLQRWLLGGVAVLFTPLVFGTGLQLVLGQGLGITAQLMINLAIGYLLIGGAVFLLSVLTRRDWLLVFIIATAQKIIAGLVQSGLPISKVLKASWQALPPFHLIRPGQPVLQGTELVHVVAYGLTMVVVALVLLRVRPLGSGGRA